MLEICLGLGILLDDACLVLFTEDEFEADLPNYIVHSVWDPSDHAKFMEYADKLQVALWEMDGIPGCVKTKMVRFLLIIIHRAQGTAAMAEKAPAKLLQTGVEGTTEENEQDHKVSDESGWVFTGVVWGVI